MKLPRKELLMNDFKVGFIGLGLIGGSIARALKHYYPGVHITAHTRSAETARYALNEGIIDKACREIDGSYGECDYISCAPLWRQTLPISGY